jgi:hypothetical protein
MARTLKKPETIKKTLIHNFFSQRNELEQNKFLRFLLDCWELMKGENA